MSTSGGGAGISQGYAGTNAIGGSTENMVDVQSYGKKIILAAPSLITEIGAYVKPANVSGDSGGYGVAILSDNAGVMGQVLNLNSYGSTTISPDGTLRWLTIPISAVLVAGTYWIVFTRTITSSDKGTIAFAAGGSDRTQAASGGAVQDGATSAQTNSTKNYSIRAGYLTGF
jgi:hypothetical protein